MRNWNPWLVGCLAALLVVALLVVLVFIGGIAFFTTTRSSGTPSIATEIVVPVVRPTATP